jgi:hypothetical protein
MLYKKLVHNKYGISFNAIKPAKFTGCNQPKIKYKLYNPFAGTIGGVSYMLQKKLILCPVNTSGRNF